MALQARLTIRDVGTQAQFKIKWIEWLSGLMSTARIAKKKAEARYKANFDRRLRKTAEVIAPGSRVFVMKDYTNPRTDTKHKFITSGNGTV